MDIQCNNFRYDISVYTDFIDYKCRECKVKNSAAPFG